ncbi:MAG: hypothetical protein NT145_00325 [Elusimicrobia bacterium]|nr:hypothetical protein [Elusimicrobiota bacterium]
MNIIEALKRMEAGDGDICTRTGEPIGICMHKDDTWLDFKKCTTYLSVEDIMADDWKILYSMGRVFDDRVINTIHETLKQKKVKE